LLGNVVFFGHEGEGEDWKGKEKGCHEKFPLRNGERSVLEKRVFLGEHT